MIFSVSEGRLRPGGEEEVVQADTVMYSNNIVVKAKEVEVEMLNIKFSVFLLVFCFNVVAQSVLLAIWRTSGNCLPRDFAPALRGSQRNLNTHMRSGCRAWDRDEEENKDRS